MITKKQAGNPFPGRLSTLRARFAEWEIDGLLITSPSNRRWLSGFTGSTGRLLITLEQSWLAVDSRYYERAANEAPDYTLFKDQRRTEDLAALLQAAAVKRVGLESDHVTLAGWQELQTIEDVSWVPLEQTVATMREVKSAAEVETIRSAAVITDLAMARVPALLYPGITERQLAWELEKTMHERGASGLAFEIIAAFGPNSALPHHSAGDRSLANGDIVLVDMGARVAGYCSDLTRTFLFAAEPDDQFQAIFDTVLRAQEAALAHIFAGADSQKAHEEAMAIISGAGHGERFTHSLGHGVGLDIHESPLLSRARPPVALRAGVVLTVEPGIYIPGWGGVRIEDLLLVKDGGPEFLSHSPKHFLISP